MEGGCHLAVPPPWGSLRRWRGQGGWWPGWGGSPGVSFPYLTRKSRQPELCEPGEGPDVLPPAVFSLSPAVADPAVLPGGRGEKPLSVGNGLPSSVLTLRCGVGARGVQGWMWCPGWGVNTRDVGPWGAGRDEGPRVHVEPPKGGFNSPPHFAILYIRF